MFPCIANKIKDGVTSLVRHEYAPVPEPGFIKQRPSTVLTDIWCVWPLINISTSNWRCKAANDSVSPHGTI